MDAVYENLHTQKFAYCEKHYIFFWKKKKTADIFFFKFHTQKLASRPRKTNKLKKAVIYENYPSPTGISRRKPVRTFAVNFSHSQFSTDRRLLEKRYTPSSDPCTRIHVALIWIKNKVKIKTTFVATHTHSRPVELRRPRSSHRELFQNNIRVCKTVDFRNAPSK